MRAYAIAASLVFGSACTLLNSESGLVGPPLVDASVDAGAGPAPPDGSLGHDGSPADADAGSTDAAPGGPLPDATMALDSGPGAPADAGPTAIYTGRTSPRGIGVYNGTLCWVEGSSTQTVACAPSAGGDSSQITTVASSTSDPLVEGAFDVALDGTYFYWSNGANNQVVREMRDGGASAPYFSGGGQVSYIVLDSTNPDLTNVWATDYVAGATSGNIIVGPSSTGSSSNMYPSQVQAAGIGVYSGSVFWGSPDAVSFGPEVSHDVVQTIATSGRVTGLAIDSSGALYFLLGNQQVSRIAPGGTVTQTLYDAGSAFGDSDLAVDDSAIYWSENTLGQIMRMPK